MTMKTSEIKWKILEDGTVSIETDSLEGPNHLSADELLTQLAEVLGGEVTTKKKSRFHVHADLSGALKAHASDGHTHQH